MDYGRNPIGTDHPQPAFSWMLQAGQDTRGCKQSAYRIIVSNEEDHIVHNRGDVWDTGKVLSSQSQHLIYNGSPLASCTRYYWKVKVWDQHGAESEWSKPSHWETAFLSASDWQADWITAPFLQDPVPEPDLLKGVPVIWDIQEPEIPITDPIRYFRLRFSVQEQRPRAAKLQIYAVDSVYIYVNGQDQGLFFPYAQTVTLDILEWTRQGDNVIAVRSDGGDKGFIAVLSITSHQGIEQLYTTADEWKVSHTPAEGWLDPAYDSGHWRSPVAIGQFGEGEWSSYKRILYPVNRGYGPNPVFGTTFHVKASLAQARLYISALGIYSCRLNGEPVSGDKFAPGWTDYHTRIPYQTYDITPQLSAGDNRLEAIVASGWYAGLIGICGPYQYGGRTALRAQLQLHYTDGSMEVISTDEQWQVSESAVRTSDMLMGECYDARMEEASPPWQAAILLDNPAAGEMKAAEGPPIRHMRSLPVKSIAHIDGSKYLVDMGQNMVGWVRLRMTGTRGEHIRLRYAERLDAGGKLYTLNLRSARQTDHYTLKGGGEEVFEPMFTYHGFQYVEIEGYPGTLTADMIEGIVIHSALEEVGQMSTSNPMVNRLLENIRWSQRGNFIGVPLDCPQRDERLGWTGDAHAFARTATYNMNSAAFYRKWLTDIRDAQREDGAYPNVAPDVVSLGAGFVFFGDGGVITPWTLYKAYGDKRYILDNYDAMKSWIAFLRRDCDERLLRRTETFGDHLSYGSETPKAVINAAFFAYSVKLMREMSEEIGETADAAEYGRLFEQLKRTFQEHFVADDGRIAGHTQTAYVLGLKVGLLSEENIPRVVQYLVEDIRRHDWHITTGFMGVSYILAVLTDYGQADTAFRLLLQDTFPSWLYPVKNGATTMWERWDGWNEEKGFQDPEMNSFNHYALGSVGEWLYRYLAGIDVAEGLYGFQKFIIRPIIGGGFTNINCRYKSLYGWIESSWEHADGVLNMLVEVPANTTAEIAVPARDSASVTIDGESATTADWSAADGSWTLLRQEEGIVWLRAGSGRYRLKSTLE
ncbi:alpha-L-rhamnosidase [Paenibacillus nasutitermitis]|uniref:alpha-L-rhamnosidase n=1 Tax=Paenibacillus nasutitermitis TaxID=1652958 RepID=UPI001E4B7B04|nr:alpha-L-rhamnosidase [Paenibacillus nasutitermitis]